MSKKTIQFDTDSNTIMVTCSTKKAETDATGTPCKWQFHLDSFTYEDIMTRAARSFVIEAQRLFRSGDLDAVQQIEKSDLVTERKPRAPSKKAATDFLAAMDPEARQQWLKENGLI